MDVLSVVFIMIQWSWGIIQNIVGFLIFICCRDRKHSYYKGTIITVWDHEFCMGIGMFIFMRETRRKDAKHNSFSQETFEKIKVHEYGHTVQSMILGPLFLPVIGIPSCMWANIPLLKRYRKEHKISYYSFYPEKWANHLGERITKSESIGEEV